jgi:acyl carrier protein
MDPDVARRVREIVAVELQRSVADVRRGVSLRKDLGMDSIAALNIVFAVEEALGIHVPEAELEGIDDLDAMFEVLERAESGTRERGSC